MKRFTEEMVADLPEPARRYLLHAVRPGTPLSDSVRLRMHGRIRVGTWLPFRAEETITAGRGFRWQASAAGGLLRGHDAYDHARAEQEFALFGLVPFLRASGPDVTRSALGRAAAESCFLPSALLPHNGVQWTAVDSAHAVAAVPMDGVRVPLTVTVDGTGALTEVTLRRWGNPEGGAYAEVPFGMVVEDEGTFGGVTIPCRGRVGWWYGSERWAKGEFFRFVLDEVGFD